MNEENSAMTALREWYRRTYEERSRAIEDGTASLDWIVAEYRVQWVELVTKARELGITTDPVTLRQQLGDMS